MTFSERSTARETVHTQDPSWSALLASVRREEARRPTPDLADFDPNYDATKPIWCEVCGSEMHYVAACKILCSNCGYRRDCSDP
jgi:hypothetical protein